MVGRWHLNRAGILNVYQYGDETIELAGGRLLLRGVNGSGKSTAMNMLLPFLIEADVRRIDASGEQTGVLRSWMLTGREELNPVGYLWVEFQLVDSATGEVEYFVCGCGIRASSSTERVTTWWFTTDRRPGIDFSFLDRRTPLTIDALRAVVGAQSVFTQERRSEYRSEVRARLFGGADLDRHVRLLHIVRSPRVGDRIDVDLPEYLGAALPELSENALSDAAQPLEDLDEHRNNVAALVRTADALGGLSTIYQSYARRELRAKAIQSIEAHRLVRAARREQETASSAALVANTTLIEADRLVQQLEDADARLDAELQALRDRPAYRDGAELVDLRQHVASLQNEAHATESDATKLGGQRLDAAHRIGDAHTRATAAVEDLKTHLGEIGGVASTWRLAPLPPFPGIESVVELEPGIGELHIPVDETADLSMLRTGLLGVVTSAELRRSDVREVLAAIDAADSLERELRAAEALHTRRVHEASTADEDATRSLTERRAAEELWRTSTQVWLEAMPGADGLEVEITREACTTALDRADLVETLEDTLSTLTGRFQAIADVHRLRGAELDALRNAKHQETERCRTLHSELLNTTLPNPPATSWQRSDRREVFAELIDFAPHVSTAAQRGIEAAMEASGLLGAEFLAGGTIALSDGELVLRPSAAGSEPLQSPLSDFVLAIEGRADVEAILAVISTELPSAVAASDPQTVIAPDGTFRIGALEGKHSKATVEHIGVSNRRAALERRRVEAAMALEEAEKAERETYDALENVRRLLVLVVEHRKALPATDALRKAVATADALTQVAGRAHAAANEAARVVARTEAAHADKLAEGHRIAANNQLPFEGQRLREGSETLAWIIVECRSAKPRLMAVEHGVQAWAMSMNLWRSSKADHVERVQRLDETNSRLASQRARLATIEDTLGAALAEVLALIETVEKDRVATREGLAQARTGVKHGAAEQSRTAEVERTAASTLADREARCAATLPVLTATLAVNGLVASAVAILPANSANSASSDNSANSDSSVDASSAVIPSWPVVTESADGARDLAVVIERNIAAPARDDVWADSVRQSLRQRRENLGAGWDAEDHQPDPSLPLAVIVTGPLGRMPLAGAQGEVANQLRQQSSLLSAKQDQALRNLLQGVVATEVAEKLFAAGELVKGMNKRLATVKTAHGIGASLRWRRRDTLDQELAGLIDLLAKNPDLRDADENARLSTGLSARIDRARQEDPDATYRDLIALVLDYRAWHEMSVLVHRPGENPRPLARHPKLSEGEKKVVSYLPLFAAVAASCDALAEHSKNAPRFLLLDDAFAKVSEDNHGPLFGLLVELDLDFIATSERLWGTHATVPELSICEVVRDAEMSTIVLEHARWNGRTLTAQHIVSSSDDVRR